MLFKITPIKLAKVKIKKYFLFFTKIAIHKILVTITRVEPSVVINFIISIIVDVSPKMDIINWYTGKSNKIIIKSPYNLKISEHNTDLS